MLVLLFVVLWFILRGDVFYVLACVILFLCFSVLLALRLPRLGKRELILVLFLRLFDLRLFGFVCFIFLLVSGKGCGSLSWHSLDFSLTLFCDPFCKIFYLQLYFKMPLPLGVLQDFSIFLFTPKYFRSIRPLQFESFCYKLAFIYFS